MPESYMKKILPLISILFVYHLQAQNLSSSNLKRLQDIEASIQGYSDSLIRANEMVDRFRADSFFIRGLIQALQVPYSFEYNFDSIKTVSKLYAPDNSFKIFTWSVMKDFTYYRQRGAIQMKTADGSLKLFPLFDFSDFTKAPGDSIRDAKHWIGAVYYKIVLKTFNNKNYYTLLGLDENNERTNKKWIEILTFDASGNPQFGGRMFSYPADNMKPSQPTYRFCIEYKKDGGVRMNYDPKYDEIIFDHLTSESNDPTNKATLIPYGDFEGFKWINGKWTFVSNPFANVIFDEKQKSLPAPLLDEKGNHNEKKLLEQSKKNAKIVADSSLRVNNKTQRTKPGDPADN